MKSKEAFSLLKKYGASDSVIAHVKKVRDYALEIAACRDCDRELVEAGAILHDIGRSRTHGIDHAVVGAEILRSEGVDERIVRIVETACRRGPDERRCRLPRPAAEGLHPGDHRGEDRLSRGQPDRQQRAHFYPRRHPDGKGKMVPGRPADGLFRCTSRSSALKQSGSTDLSATRRCWTNQSAPWTCSLSIARRTRNAR